MEDNLEREELERLRLLEFYQRNIFGGGREQELGWLFLNHRNRYGLTQQEFARRIRLTPGTIHHYESLEKTLIPELQDALRAHKLTFKEARSIAAFTIGSNIPDCDRQRDIAAPFLSGELSSVVVERLVGLAKANPELGISALRQMLDGRRFSPAPEPREDAKKINPDDLTVPNADLPAMIAKLAGELDALTLQGIPGYERRLPLLTQLRILEPKVQAALLICQVGSRVAS